MRGQEAGIAGTSVYDVLRGRGRRGYLLFIGRAVRQT
jgi:hypothetical protein